MLKNSSPAHLVAQVIYKAATDNKRKLRYMAGTDAKMYDLLNKILGYRFVYLMNKKLFNL